MNKKAVALFSGGLDSTLAICILKEQGIEIEAVHFQTPYGCCKDGARQMAYQLGIGFTMLGVGDDYFEMLKKPKFGYGRGTNPCVDCRAYMFREAKHVMETIGASFIVSGEVAGQRPMSQKLRNFREIEQETGLAGLILRPLSAKILPVTEPEKAGIVDREKLYAIQGRSRSEVLKLAGHYGIQDPQDASAGCALAQPLFAKKVRDLFKYHRGAKRWEFEVLRIGRHFRLDPGAKAVLGKNENQNAYLEELRPKGTAVLVPENFNGPSALVIGQATEERLQKTASLVLYYAKRPLPDPCEMIVRCDSGQKILAAKTPADETMMELMRIV